jgi:septal ring factor EnvC (AmiA/AmiB activator)
MAEWDRNGLSARLRRLPGQLLLALVNAAVILVIAAAVLVLVAVNRINHFAENIASTMTAAVLSKVDLPSKEVMADLRNLTAEVRRVGNAIEQIKTGENSAFQAEIAKLKETLTVLRVNVDRLGRARSMLTDEAIGQFGRRVSDTLIQLRECRSGVARMEADPLGSETLERREIAGH